MFCVAAPNPMTKDMALEDADLRLGALSDLGLQALLDRLVLQDPSTGKVPAF